jgi:hypothetical protein
MSIPVEAGIFFAFFRLRAYSPGESAIPAPLPPAGAAGGALFPLHTPALTLKLKLPGENMAGRGGSKDG